MFYDFLSALIIKVTQDQLQPYILYWLIHEFTDQL